ncbi:hypothetical protein [Massilia sp. GCM10023247]|uniref:hypothetical protein n=1 Tax=Massilia sp. GCM10023247 TaxID=3252643 RepID=UPI0036076740
MAGAIALLSACSNKDGTAPPPVPDKAVNRTSVSMPEALPAPSVDIAPASSANLLRASGVGGIRFGMTLAQAEQASGAKAVLPTSFDPACSMVRFPALPALRFMLENGIVTRADAGPGVETALGVAIGDTLAQVRARHPEVQVSAHKYDENGHYLTFPEPDGRSAVILEESGGKVTKMRAGLLPAVAYVETCG